MKQTDRGDVSGDEMKRSYEAPELVRWGTLQDLTQSVGNRGASDGGRKNQKRTSY